MTKASALFSLFIFYSLCVTAQVEYGSYTLIYLDREESILIINDMGRDHVSKFFVYSEDTSCILLEISSRWEVTDNKVCYVEQKQKERFDCKSEYLPIENIDSNCYDIIEKNDGYFIGQSDFDNNVKIKWVKR